ncbi:hypothetical protein [Mycolicibacterium obuense]|nr:hypothetical protein [Mycolicibacterium obuense]
MESALMSALVAAGGEPSMRCLTWLVEGGRPVMGVNLDLAWQPAGTPL